MPIPRTRRSPADALLACALASALAGALAGCAVTRRPPVTREALLAGAPAEAARSRAVVDSVIARLAARAAARGDRTLDVLLLSGGGQNGAYGAGFLRGWGARADAPMPRFDLVTGISTGSLQAPYALLGDAAALDTVSALYRGAAERIAPRIDWLVWLRRTGGVVRPGRYVATVRASMDGAMRARLAPALAEGRSLVVGTTDLDLGTWRLWDLGGELRAGDAGLARTQEALIASTAIPGIFPPRVIDGHVHVDGGVIGNLLPMLALDDYRRLGEALRARGVAGDVTVRTWVVLNLWTHMPPAVVNPSRRGAIASRGDLTILLAQQREMVQRLHDLARAVPLDVPGVRLEVRHTAIPAELSLDPAASKLFDRRFMARLDSLGHARGSGASPWDPPPLPYARPATGGAPSGR